MIGLDRLSLNQGTIKKATLRQALDATVTGGVSSIGLWREPVAEIGLGTAVAMVHDSGLRVSSLCRAGFFTTTDDAAFSRALDDDRAAIDETAALAAAGAPGSRPVLVLVAGGLPTGTRDLIGARDRVLHALDELVPAARGAGVTLAIEALHPMYAADRCVVSTLGQALEIAERYEPEAVGVVVDTFHVWWEPGLLDTIHRAGAARIAAYQVCDWLTPIAADPLLSRGQPGTGCIDFAPISDAVVEAGYTGDVEVEIFNQTVWDTPFDEVVQATVHAFRTRIAR